MERKALERLAGGVFVGREPVLAHLEAGLEQARRGRSAWYLLSGEPGIGKSRTAEEIARRARRRGFAVHTGRCPEEEGAPPYRPWLQILRSLVGAPGSEDARALLGEIGPAGSPLGALLPELAPGAPPPGVDSAARFRLFEAVAALLAAAARRTPRALVFDDLHRADEASLALLDFCAGEVAAAPLLVLATRREPEAFLAAPGERRAALARSFREVPLRGLRPDELRAFFAALFERDPAPGFVAAVHERTEGNPLLVTELARLLLLEDRLDPADPAPALAATLPGGVRDVVGERVQRLTPRSRRLLAAASVIGRDFHRELLARVVEADLAGELGPLLDEACAARVLMPLNGGPGAFRFAHALIRERLYEDLALDDRARLHGRVVRALEALHPIDASGVASELAHHARAAETELGPERAAHWAGAAGQEAARRLAFDDAGAHFRAALELLARVEPAGAGAARERDRRACSLRLDLARCLERAGAASDAVAHYREAADAARRLGDAALFASAALGLAGERMGTATHAPDRERVALLEEALALTAEDRYEARVPLLGRLAIELHWTSDRTRRDALAERAVALARESGDPTLLSQALVGAIWATWGPDNPAWRRAAASEALAREAEVRDPVPLLSARVARATAALELGDVAACDEDVAAGARLAADLHHGLSQVFFGAIRTMRALLEGRFAEGERLANENLALGRRIDSPHTPGVHASHLVLIRSEQGRLAELEPAFGAFAERAGHPIIRASLVWLRARLGKHAEALRELRSLLARGVEDLPVDFMWLGSIALLAEAAALLGARRPVRLLYEALVPYADRTVVVGMSAGCLGSASRYLGLLAGALGRYDVAERHFEAALEANARLRALPFLARTQEELAVMLRERARPGDADRAAKLLDEAAGLRAELAALEPAPPAPQAPPTPAAVAPAPGEGLLALGGETWTVGYAGSEAHVRDGRGMRYLAILLERAGEELHALDLVARAGGEAGVPEGVGGLEPVLDPRARAEYRERLGDLGAELEAAERANDLGRAELARQEIDALERALAAAFGLGGHTRRLGDPAERARKAVYNRLRTAISMIEAAHPALGRHLANAIQTGAFCSYRPDRPVRWSVERGASF